MAAIPAQPTSCSWAVYCRTSHLINISTYVRSVSIFLSCGCAVFWTSLSSPFALVALFCFFVSPFQGVSPRCSCLICPQHLFFYIVLFSSNTPLYSLKLNQFALFVPGVAGLKVAGCATNVLHVSLTIVCVGWNLVYANIYYPTPIFLSGPSTRGTG